jgi:hypothetical protein
MIKQLSNSKTGGVFLIVLAIMLNACASTAAARAVYATACHPPTVEGNVYRQVPQNALRNIYSRAFSNMDFNNPNSIQNFDTTQYEAIQLLATQTEKWSDFVDISLGSKYVRLTITYLSPELIHTIILNHYLFRKNGSYLNSGFETGVASLMEKVANRNEHIFLATLTASTYKQDTSYTDPVIVQLPLRSLVLTNSSNVQVIPQHDDHNLEERIDLTQGPAHGSFSYPMAVMVNENCEFLMDDTTNMHLVLSIPYIDINGMRYETRPWVLEYTPLLDIALDPNPIENMLQVDRTPDHFRPTDDPPVSITPVTPEYWETMARFIWHEVTQDP